MMMKREKAKQAFVSWLPLAVAVTGLSGLVFLSAQQDLRQGANDPQIQIAEDAAARISAGEDPRSVVPAGMIDIASSLAPFVMVFDPAGNPMAGNAIEADKNALPMPPRGIFDASRWAARSGGRFNGVTPAGESRVTWQTASGIRSAIVIVRAGNGDFVVAGRSLREVESRESQLLAETALAWSVTMIATLAFSFIAALL